MVSPDLACSRPISPRYELLCEIRKIRNSVSVIMISAYESIDLVERCILSGADAYLLKPLRMHELRNIWQYVWRRRHEVLVRQHAQQIGAEAETPMLRDGVAAIEGAPEGQGPGPDLEAAQKIKGERQRLSNPDPPELQKAARELEKLEMASKQGLERALASETKLLLQESQAQNKKLLGGQARRASPRLGVLAEIDSEPTSGASSDQGQPSLAEEGVNDLSGMVEEDEEREADAEGDDEESEGDYEENEDEVCSVAGGMRELGMAGGGGYVDSSSSEDEGAESNEKTVCRLCEKNVLLRDLTHHLVLCTAAHSCREELRKVDTSLKLLSSRVRKKQSRMRAAFRRAEASLDPLELVSAYADGAAGVLARDPMMTAYKLMELQNSSRTKIPGGNKAYEELWSQVDGLVNQKMGLHWDLLSLQDPDDPAGETVSNVSSKGMSIREFQLVEPLGSGGRASISADLALALALAAPPSISPSISAALPWQLRHDLAGEAKAHRGPRRDQSALPAGRQGQAHALLRPPRKEHPRRRRLALRGASAPRSRPDLPPPLPSRRPS